MGLDQRLIIQEYVSSPDARFTALVDVLGYEPTPDSPGIVLNVPVVYWRKAYWLQDWFESHGVEPENGGHAYVTIDVRNELIDALDTVLSEPERAEELFPADGSWGGGGRSEHGEYFYQDVRRTYTELKRIFDDPQFGGKEFYYEADW